MLPLIFHSSLCRAQNTYETHFYTEVAGSVGSICRWFPWCLVLQAGSPALDGAAQKRTHRVSLFFLRAFQLSHQKASPTPMCIILI